ncbi:MAG: ATP synthase F0 subunit B [Acidobacteria bacterium]|nr:ATP synthase F0 subunit B [Acidobacteriota bacterium]
MKRLILALALTVAAIPATVFAQEGGSAAAHEGAAQGKEEKKDEGSLEIWKWANFVLLGGGLGYLIGKNAGPFFAGRSAAIRQDMEESLRARQDAEARAAEVERRLATLEGELAALRAESERELKAGAELLARQTAEEIEKIQAHAGHEIETASKQARAELKRYAAELAIGVAGQKVRARMTPAAQDQLVDGFVRDLK